MTDPVNSVGMDQADYMKIFMQELTYQDPLKPVDNKEFMAQMAQFSALQQAKETNEGIGKLLNMTAASQGLNLLGKNIQFNNGSGRVNNVKFDQSGTKLEVSSLGETYLITLQDITAILGGN